MRLAVSLLFALGTVTATAHSQGVQGYWTEPGGSIIRVAPCGADFCATLVEISPTAPARVDGLNPDPALRSRTLCGVQIGTGFHSKGPDEAGDGMLYDPKSGKTYHGVLRVKGEKLHLRGYVGARLFGRTEIWSRTQPVSTCKH